MSRHEGTYVYVNVYVRCEYPDYSEVCLVEPRGIK